MMTSLNDDTGFSDSISEAPLEISTENDDEIPTPQGSPSPENFRSAVTLPIGVGTAPSVKVSRDAMVSAACSIQDIPSRLMISPLINSKSFRERRKSVRFTEIVTEHIIEETVSPVNKSESLLSDEVADATKIPVIEPAVVEPTTPAAEPTIAKHEDPVMSSPHRRLHSHPVIVAALHLDDPHPDPHSVEPRVSVEATPPIVVEPEVPHAEPVKESVDDSSSASKPKLERWTTRKYLVTIDKVKENNDKINALYEENNAAIKQAIRDSRVILGNILDDTAPSAIGSLSASVTGNDSRSDEELLAAKYFLAREALLQKKRSDISNQTVMDILKNHSELSPFLQHCCTDDLTSLVEDATAVDFSHSETVMAFKDFVNCIYIVLQGSITIHKYSYEINDETGEIVWDTRHSSGSVNHPGSLIGRSALEGLTQWDCTGVNHSTDSLSLAIIKDKMKSSHEAYRNSISGHVKSIQEDKDYTLSLCAIPIETVLRYIGLHTLAAKDMALYFWKYTRLYNEITRFNRDYVISSMALTYGKKRRSIVTDYRMMDVLGTAKIRKFPANVEVFKQGQSRHYLFYLTKGSAKYVRQYPDWINDNKNGNGAASVASAPHQSVALPAEIELELILSRGDYSFMDGENVDWVKHMAKVDETILRSKTENPLLYEHKKRKYSRFEFHKNTLVTMTKCEMISIPISEIVKSMTLFNNLLSLTNKKYSVLNISNEDLVHKYYKQQEWLKEKAALVHEIMTEKQANKVADYFYCAIDSNLNLDYCRRHTPGSAVRPLTASVECQETAKFKKVDSNASNSGSNTARSSTDASLSAILKAKASMHMPSFSNTATTATSLMSAAAASVPVPEYSSYSIHMAQVTNSVAPYRVDTPRPQSASAAYNRRNKSTSSDPRSQSSQESATTVSKSKVVFGYGIYTRYVNDATEVDADTFFLTSDANGGSGSSPRRPQSARSMGTSSRPGSARTSRPLSVRSAASSNRAAASGGRPISASTFGKSLRFGGTNNNTNESPSFTPRPPAAAEDGSSSRPVQQRPSSAPPSSSSARRFSRPAVAKLNFSVLNKTMQDPPAETRVIPTEDDRQHHPGSNNGEDDDIQLPKHDKGRRRGGNLQISNLLDLVYQANELKKRLEEEQRDNGDGDGYIYRYKSDYGHRDSDSSSESGSENQSVGSRTSMNGFSTKHYPGAHNTSRDEQDEVTVVPKEEKELHAAALANEETEVDMPRISKRLSSGYGQAPTNAVKKSPDFYAQIYKERLVSNSPKKRFIDEYISKKLE